MASAAALALVLPGCAHGDLPGFVVFEDRLADGALVSASVWPTGWAESASASDASFGGVASASAATANVAASPDEAGSDPPQNAAGAAKTVADDSGASMASTDDSGAAATVADDSGASMASTDDSGAAATLADDSGAAMTPTPPGAGGSSGPGAFAPGVTASPAIGDLLITEVMFAPSGPVPESEWFEVYNAATSPRLLSGLTIVDGAGDAHVIGASAPVVAPTGAYVLLVRDLATALNNGLPASAIVYAYGAGLADGTGIELDVGLESGVWLYSGSTELADVPYGRWDLASPGQSLELDSGLLTPGGSNGEFSWCSAKTPWATGSDWGTPGAPSDCP